MAKKHHKPEQGIFTLREAEGARSRPDGPGDVQAPGHHGADILSLAQGIRGLKADQVKKLKALERVNTCLKQVVAGSHLDKAIVSEAMRGNC